MAIEMMGYKDLSESARFASFEKDVGQMSDNQKYDENTSLSLLATMRSKKNYFANFDDLNRLWGIGLTAACEALLFPQKIDVPDDEEFEKFLPDKNMSKKKKLKTPVELAKKFEKLGNKLVKETTDLVGAELAFSRGLLELNYFVPPEKEDVEQDEDLWNEEKADNKLKKN